MYQKEVFDSIEELKKNNVMLSTMDYFYNTTIHYFDPKFLTIREPEIVVFGQSIPEELIYAVGVTPFWVSGGSLESASWATPYVVRDTDDMCQSMYGQMIAKQFGLARNALIIIPITCDSMRKMAYMLSKTANVVTVDLPPNKNSIYAREKWLQEMRKLVHELQKKTKQKITMETLKKSVKLVQHARVVIKKFRGLCKENRSILSGVLELFVLNSYYFTENLEEWTEKLEELNREMERLVLSEKEVLLKEPQVLLLGSPIIFPNYKIPFLLKKCGLEIARTISCISERLIYELEEIDKIKSMEELFEKVVLQTFWQDCSSAYIDNISLFNQVTYAIQDCKVNGVIYHVLKGQTEYDFELKKYEEYFSTLNIPIIRLETDYSYQDLEQLRIRIEAFAELISLHSLN